MVNLFQMNSHIISILIALTISITILIKSALKMVEQKRFLIFIPFFVLGGGTCLFAGFMFYDFFGVAIDVFYTFCFVFVVSIFLVLLRCGK